MKNKILILGALPFAFFLVACGGTVETEPNEIVVEVTREVEVIVEVTREAEVTRIVEVVVEVTPTASHGGGFGSEQCLQYTLELEKQVERWEDSVELAISTPRASLGDRIADMQIIKRDTLDLDEPECASSLGLRDKAQAMMEDGVSFFTSFLADEGFGFDRAQYIISRDVFGDAFDALLGNSQDVPRRIHYFGHSADTGFSISHLDEEGGTVIPSDAEESGRYGTPDMPVVFTALIPEGEVASITLFNATYENRDITCAILVNGIEVTSDVGQGTVTCELSE